MSDPGVADRVAFVVCTAEGADLRVGQGALDADAISERLALPDAAFELVRLSPAEDLAEQLGDYGEKRTQEPVECAVLYASTRLLAANGEALLALDAANPDTCDSVADVVGALTDLATGLVLVILDLVCKPGADAVALAEVVRSSVRLPERVELIVCVRPLAAEESRRAQAPSPFTKAVLEALDAADPAEGLYAVEMFEGVRDAGKLGGVVPALIYASGPDSVPLLLVSDEVGDSLTETREQTSSVEEGHEEDEEEEPEPDPSEMETPIAPMAVMRAMASPSAPPPPESRPPPALTPDQIFDEADELVAAGDDEGALARYRKALAVLGPGAGVSKATEGDPHRARTYARMGAIKARQGKTREAIGNLEKALELDAALASFGGVLKPLLKLYLAERDMRAVQAIEERILAGVRDPAKRARLLTEFGRTWLHDLGDRLRARETLESARALAPGDREVLTLLLEVAESDGRSDDAISLKRSLADTESDPHARGVALHALGKAHLKAKREEDALDVLEAALEADPVSTEPLTLISSLLADRQEWGELEGVYRRMLERTPRVLDPKAQVELEVELHRRLALLLRDHLEDPEAALAAFESGLSVRADDVGLLRAAAELARKIGKDKVASRHLESIIALDPVSPVAHRAFFDMRSRADEIEGAADAAQVLVQLGVAGDRERIVFEANKPETNFRPTGQLDGAAWARLRQSLHPSAPDVEYVARVFDVVAATAVYALSDLATRAGKLPTLDERSRVDPATSTVAAVRSLEWASHALGIDAPRVYLDEASRETFTAVLRPRAVTVVGAGAIRGRELAELAFLAGYHLSGHVPEHRLAGLCATSDDLAACFLAAARIAVPDVAVPERLRGSVEILMQPMRERMTPEVEASLEEVVLEFDAAGGKADLAAYARSVARAGVRAGLLLSRDLALSVAACRTVKSGWLDATELEGELLTFCSSRMHAELREQLGDASD